MPSYFSFSATRVMTRILTGGLIAVCAAGTACAQQEVPLWPDGAPGFRHARPEAVEDKHETGRLDRYISFVSNPTLTLYPVAGASAPGPMVLVLPGGGFRYVAIDKEGHEVARWLNSVGIAAAVLKYRVVDPDLERNWDNLSPLLALGDAARAVRLLRQNAAEWKIDPAHVGVLGFSAGGTMAIRLTIDANAGKADAADPVERLSSRPDFVGLIYTTLPDGKQPKIDRNMPFFIAQAADDKKAPMAISTKLLQYIVNGGGSAELHVFRQGDHGFGVLPPAGTVRAWPTLFVDWMKDVGALK